MKKRIYSGLLILALILAVSGGGAVQATESSGNQVILSWAENPEPTSQTFSWTTGQSESTYIEYIAESVYNAGGGSYSRVYGIGKAVRVTSNVFYRYEATATGLSPNTAYRYRVVSGGGAGAWKKFTTAPQRSESFSFLYFGDIQVVSNMAAELSAWSALAQTAYNSNPGAAFGMIGGDIVESGLDSANWSAFLNAAEPVFSQIPLMPVNGNHESNHPGGKPLAYTDVFALPKNGPAGFEEEFYSFNYGDAHITVVNTHVYSGEQGLSGADYDAIKEWIREDIASSRAKWKMVALHHPVYAVANDGVSALVLQNWAPVFEETGVDVVFEGHQHVYARSMPLYQGQVDYENGIVYIMGVSGSKFYSTANENLMARVIYNQSCYQAVEADGDTLSISTYSASGALLDSISLSAREREYEFIP
ncbi:MAG: metallophosphoesterase family protein, partial [Oscillospiraceae bacterium]|nr:metallophosphoesterase family protein [Oscillospiraceae bacterium]